MQAFGDLLLTPIGPVVNVAFSQAKDAIALRLKPFIFALVALLDQWQGMPVSSVTFNNEAGVFDHKIADELTYLLLWFIGRAAFAKPRFNNDLDFGTLCALVKRRPCTLTLAGTEFRPLGKRRLGFIALPTPFTHKDGRGLIKGVLGSPNRSLPFVQASVGAKPPLLPLSAGPYPELLAARLAITIDALLWGHSYTFSRLCPTGARAILSPRGGRCNNKPITAHFTACFHPLFKRLSHALLRAVEFIVMLFTADRALSHWFPKTQGPGCAMSLSRRRGCRGLVIAKYIRLTQHLPHRLDRVNYTTGVLR